MDEIKDGALIKQATLKKRLSFCLFWVNIFGKFFDNNVNLLSSFLSKALARVNCHANSHAIPSLEDLHCLMFGTTQCFWMLGNTRTCQQILKDILEGKKKNSAVMRFVKNGSSAQSTVSGPCCHYRQGGVLSGCVNKHDSLYLLGEVNPAVVTYSAG